MFGLEEPWPPQLIQRIIPWQIILNEGFPKPPAFWKVTSLVRSSESSHVSALAGGGIPKGRDGGGRTGCHVVGMSAEGTACHTPAWGSAVPQVNILMSNFHSVVFSQHMGFKKQLKENCTHLLISEACDFRRACQINFHIQSISELQHTEECSLSFEIVVWWPKKNRYTLLQLHGITLTDGLKLF